MKSPYPRLRRCRTVGELAALLSQYPPDMPLMDTDGMPRVAVATERCRGANYDSPYRGVDGREIVCGVGVQV